MSAPPLEHAIALWAAVDLSAERHEALDRQALSIADNQQDSAVGREALKEVIRDFKSTPTEERLRRIGQVIKAFQAEVDALTRRQTFAEEAYLDLYRSLANAPDLNGALTSAAEDLRKAQASEAELPGLKEQLAHFEEEFASLKNQEHTIRMLQQQLREAEASASAQGEATAASALVEAEERWSRERATLLASAAEAQAESALRLSRVQDEARAAWRARAAAEEEVAELRASGEREAEAAEAEAESFRREIERLTVQLQLAKTASERGDSPVANSTSSGAAATTAAMEERALAAEASLRQSTARAADLEMELRSRDAALSSYAVTAAALEARIAALEAELATRPVAYVPPTLPPPQRPQPPTPRASVGTQSQLCAENTVAGVRACGDALHLESLTEEKRRLTSEITVIKGLLADAEEALLVSRRAEADAAHRIAEQAETISALEDELVGRCAPLTASTSSIPLTISTSGAPLTPLSPSNLLDAAEAGLVGPSQAAATVASSGGGAMLRLVASQRDRARKEAAAAAAETSSLREQLRIANASARKLHGDNLTLYEKIRYLEAMAGENAPRPLSRTGSCTPLLAVSGGEATSDRQSSTSASATRTTRRETSGVKSSAEAKYAREYDARLNPFDAFQRRERQARYNALSPAEKLLLAVSSMLFSDRRARIAFFIYIVVLHLMVFGTTVHHALVHSVAQRSIERHTLS